MAATVRQVRAWHHPARRPVKALTAAGRPTGYAANAETGAIAIARESKFEDCVVLHPDAFDPDAVFLDDIVDDGVLPHPTLAVDGLTGTSRRTRGELELRPEDAMQESIPASTTMPVAAFDPEQLEVYGWESSVWKKIRGYLGF